MKKNKKEYSNPTDNEMSLQEIGDILGITRERVRQIEKSALDKIRKYLLQNPNKAETLKETFGEITELQDFGVILAGSSPNWDDTRISSSN